MRSIASCRVGLTLAVNLGRGHAATLTFSHNFNRVPTRPVARPKKNVGLSRQLFGMHSSSSFSTSISRHLTRYTKIVAKSQPLDQFSLAHDRDKVVRASLPCYMVHANAL